MLEKGAIERIPPTVGQFVGHVFLRPKKNGTYRLVFNLKPLNQYIVFRHFKMERLTMLTTMIQNLDWMMTIDLHDAYLCLPINSVHRKYMRFMWRGQLFQFSSVPFGLSPAPREFTTLLKPVMAILRKLGMRILIFLNNIIILNQNRDILTQDRDSIIWLLQHRGFNINWEKSSLNPSQRVEYLGLIIDSQTMILTLTGKKVHDLQTECRSILNRHTVSVKALSKLIGKLSASVMAIQIDHPILLPPMRELLLNVTSGGNSSAINNRSISVSGMETLRQRFKTEGFSEESADLLLESRRAGTQVAYTGPWQKWSGWCGKRKINPLQATVGQIAGFLTKQFKRDLEYSTIKHTGQPYRHFTPPLGVLRLVNTLESNNCSRGSAIEIRLLPNIWSHGTWI